MSNDRSILVWERYQRHLQLPDFSPSQQRRLQNARVLVVGAGGLGLPALLTLATAGVGTLGIVDGDIVELHNLHRQWLYELEDIGRNKAQAVGRHLQRRNPEVAYHIYPSFLTPHNVLTLLAEYDYVLDGTDNLASRYLINDAAYFLGKPIAYGAVYQYEGEWGLLNVLLDSGDRSPNYRDLYPEPPDPTVIPSCSDVGVFGPLPNLIGILQATALLQLIAGVDTVTVGSIFRIDLRSYRWEQFHLLPHPQNPLRQPGWRFIPQQYTAGCPGVPEVDWEQIPPDAELIDIREEWERQQCSAGGRHLPLSQLRLEDIPKDRPVYIYCASGNRSAQLVSLLRHRGWQNVWNIRGGIAAKTVEPTQNSSDDKV